MILFLFHDDIEEILVAAEDAHDAFQVIEEEWGSDAADALILSHLYTYAEPVPRSRGIMGHSKPGTYKR